jgi:hypothetical protein
MAAVTTAARNMFRFMKIPHQISVEQEDLQHLRLDDHPRAAQSYQIVSTSNSRRSDQVTRNGACVLMEQAKPLKLLTQFIFILTASRRHQAGLNSPEIRWS